MSVLKPARLRLRRSDRAAFVGKTGSGKTTLEKSLAWGERYVLVLDPKRTYTLPAAWPVGFRVIEGHEPPAEWEGETLIVRPGLDTIAGGGKKAMMAWADGWLWFAFNRGGVLVYVDEVMAITTPQTAPDGLAACLQMGRERRVGTWCATQRPTMMPLIVLTESEHFFVFRLNHPDDRQRLADYTEPKVRGRPGPNGTILNEPVPLYAFWYYASDTGARYYARADVGPILQK